MDIKEVLKAKSVAKEFIKRADEYAKVCAESAYKSDGHTFYCSNPIQSGALRRQSMELTRQLAKMRKP